MGLDDRGMVQRGLRTTPAESGGKSWPKEISITPRGPPDEMSGTKKRRFSGEKRRFLITISKEEFLCPWQAWQRPTLPGLKP